MQALIYYYGCLGKWPYLCLISDNMWTGVIELFNTSPYATIIIMRLEVIACGGGDMLRQCRYLNCGTFKQISSNCLVSEMGWQIPGVGSGFHFQQFPNQVIITQGMFWGCKNV